MEKNKIYDLIIIGGGAAGLMAATVVGQSQKSILILDATDDLASKIRISGGGNCNFSNAHLSAENYVSQNAHFCKSVLASYRTDDFKKLLEKNGIAWEERTGGKLFSFSGDKIAEMLLDEVQNLGVHIKNNCLVKGVVKEDYFKVMTPKEVFQAHSVLVASGGLSIPKIGASNIGFEIANSFGLKVIPPKPALTGFLWSEKEQHLSALAGISLPVVITIGTKKIASDLLFTHKGISGPAVLNASLYWAQGMPIKIDFLGTLAQNIWQNGKTFSAAVGSVLPKKLVSILLTQKDRDIANATKQEKQIVLNLLTQFTFTPMGLEGYHKAEVTNGGVSTDELNQSTLACKKISGLYFAGEIIDVTGQLGGYNLHWAWASGYAVGKALKKED